MTTLEEDWRSFQELVKEEVEHFGKLGEKFAREVPLYRQFHLRECFEESFPTPDVRQELLERLRKNSAIAREVKRRLDEINFDVKNPADEPGEEWKR